MRSAFSLVLVAAAASLVAAVGAVPSVSSNVIGTVRKVWPNRVSESTNSADEYGTVVNEKRQTVDLSNTPCVSTCSGAPGTGPNQNDCDIIVNELFSESISKFSVDTANNVLSAAFGSCRVNFVNFTGGVVVYQHNEWGNVADFLAGKCNAANGFGQGRCNFDNTNAFIEVVLLE